MKKDKKEITPDESDKKPDKKAETSPRRSAPKKDGPPQGRYWGIVFLLFTVLMSLLFRFLS